MDVEEPEDDPTERALRCGDEEAAFHRRPRDFGKLAEKQLFAVIPEGQGLDEEFLDLGAVYEQEERNVEDERQVGQESQGVLAQGNGIFGEEAAGGKGRSGQEAFDAFKIVPGVVEPVLKERIGIFDPVDVTDKGILIGVQPLVEEGCLDNAVIEDVRERNDDEDEAEKNSYE